MGAQDDPFILQRPAAGQAAQHVAAGGVHRHDLNSQVDGDPRYRRGERQPRGVDLLLQLRHREIDSRQHAVRCLTRDMHHEDSSVTGAVIPQRHQIAGFILFGTADHQQRGDPFFPGGERFFAQWRMVAERTVRIGAVRTETHHHHYFPLDLDAGIVIIIGFLSRNAVTGEYQLSPGSAAGGKSQRPVLLPNGKMHFVWGTPRQPVGGAQLHSRHKMERLQVALNGRRQPRLDKLVPDISGGGEFVGRAGLPSIE